MRTIVEKWVHPDYWPHPADPEALDRVEARFETYLPRCFRQCLEQVGPPSPGLALLSAIVDQRLSVPSLGDFLEPDEMIETTWDWHRAGLPEDMVAFATDVGGNLYCFQVVPETEPVPDDATVWYFDHEEREVESLDLAFSKWLALYAGIPRVPKRDDA
jgi:hypothetical protein